MPALPLKDDKREIFRIAADAHRIVNMTFGFHPDYAAHMDIEADIPASLQRQARRVSPQP